jgi:hypothetical protein
VTLALLSHRTEFSDFFQVHVELTDGTLSPRNVYKRDIEVDSPKPIEP